MVEAVSRVYQERTGIGVVHDIETILSPDKPELTAEEFQTVCDFSRDLFAGRYDTLAVAGEADLESVNNMNALSNVVNVYHGYLGDDEAVARDIIPIMYRGKNPATGQQVTDEELWQQIMADRELFAVGGRGPHDAIVRVGMQVDDSQIRTLKEVGSRGNHYLRAKIADALVHPGHTTDGSFLGQTPESTSVFLKPNELIDKMESLHAYRNFYKSVLHELQDDRTELVSQKRDIANMYLGKVNSIIAGLYPSFIELSQQQLGNFDNPEVTDRFLARLDKLRNGVAISPEDGSHQVLSQELLNYVASEEKETQQAGSDSLLPDAMIAELDTIVWGADQLAELNEAVLEEWGLLSSVRTTWEEVDKRVGWAEAGKLQVIITPESSSLSVNSSKGVVKIPESYERGVTDDYPAGVLSATAHELTHALQAIIDRQTGDTIPLARIKGRHALALREGAGANQERVIQSEYFGREGSASTHYLRALQAKLDGEDVVGVARAFLDSYREDFPNVPIDKAASVSADRALRLYRNGGYNSQPLDYIEQGLIAAELDKLDPEVARRFILGAGSFNVKDLATLAKIGLFKLPDVEFSPAHDVMRVFQREFAPHSEVA